MGICEKGNDELLIDAIRNYPHLYNPANEGKFVDRNFQRNGYVK